MVRNRGIIFKQVPKGWPIEGQDLVLEDREFDIDTGPPPNGITTQNFYASFDPYQRGRMRPAEVKSYVPAFQLGKPIDNATIARVIKSANDKFAPGDIITGILPTEEYTTVPAHVANAMLHKLHISYHLDPKIYLGALGMPGLTAYASFYAIGNPRKGETIFISSASGPVGQLVGQLAKHEGLTVIGSVGSDEKLKFITSELGFDDGFNYKTEKPTAALKRLAPKGVDIYFENVGGEQLDAALAAMNNFGRIIACGMISQYNAKNSDELYGVKNMTNFMSKRLKMQGFIVGDADMGPKYTDAHQENVAKWISEGTFKHQETVTYGIENGIKGFIDMLKGEIFGKAVLQIGKLSI